MKKNTKPRQKKPTVKKLTTDLDKWLAAGEKVIETTQEILELFQSSPVMSQARERHLEERVSQLEAQLQLVAAVLTELVIEGGTFTVSGTWIGVKPLPLVLEKDFKTQLITVSKKDV